MKAARPPAPLRGVTIAARIVLGAAAIALAAVPARADPPPFVLEWGLGFANASGIASNPFGEIFVSDPGGSRIVRYSSNGTLLSSITGSLRDNRGVAVDEAGNVCVADYGNNAVRRFTPGGSLINSWAVPVPVGVAAGGGYVFVLSGDAVFKYSTAGSLVTSWGSTGSGAGQFSGPVGIALDRTGYVYVADTGNHRVQKFTPAGSFVAEWGSSGSGDGQFSSPQGLAADRYDHLIVADTGNHRLQAFTTAGAFLGRWGSLGSANGEFDSPRGVAIGASGQVYALDTGNSRVQMFGTVTTTGLTSSVNPSVYGQATQLTAFLNPLSPGTMTFYDGATPLGSVPVSGSPMTLSVGGLSAGSHSLTARYSGDASHSASESPPVLQTVNQASTTTGIQADLGTSGLGQRVTFTATVAVVPPGAGILTGLVTFYDGGTPLGTSGVGGGMATLPVTSLAVGSHSITASYAGDPNHQGSASAPLPHDVIPPGTAPVFLTKWGSLGGGPGFFNQPRGVALAPNGDLYVVDQANSRVQYFRSGGSSFGGTWGVNGSGPGQFASPTGIAIDPSGYVYVADYGNHRIQKFTPTGGYLTQWGSIGSGNGQFQGPADVAVSASGSIYVLDAGNRRVQVFSSIGFYVFQWGGGGTGDGQFVSPAGIAVAPGTGEVYVSDPGLSRIQRFTSTGGFLAKWGSGGSGNGQFTSVAGLSVDASGNVHVADMNRIQVFTSGGAYLAQWGTTGTGDGQFQAPYGVVVNAAGTVTVSDRMNHRIQKFGAATSTTMTSSANPSVFGQPVDLVASVTPSAATGSVTFYEDATPLASAGLVGGTASASHAGLAVGSHSLTARYEGGPDHAASVSPPITQVVTRATPAFALATDPSPSGLGQPVTIRVTLSGAPPGAGVPTGTVTFLDGAAVLGGATLSGGMASLVSALAPDGPHALTVSYDGDESFVPGTSPPLLHPVLPLDRPGLPVSQWGAAGTGNGQFSSPFDVATDAARNVFVADRGNHRIQKFSPSGGFLTKWGTPGILGNGQFDSPSGVAVDAAGAVYVCDTGNHLIQKFSNGGVFLLQWGSRGSGDGELQSPADLAVDPEGNVLVCDTGNHRVQKFSSTGAYLARWGSAGGGEGQFQSPGAIAVDGSGNVFVCDTGNHRVQEFAGDGTFLRQWGSPGSGPGRFQSPAGIVVEPAGNVLVADTGNDRIQKFGPQGAFLAEWGTTGSALGELDAPRGMAVDGLGYLLVSDSGNQRVQRFRRPAWITSIADVPGDQGLQVRVRFLADALDIAAAAEPIVRYDVFRRIDGSAAARAARPADPRRPRPAGVQVNGWDLVGTHAAFADSVYNLIVPTLADSNDTGPHTAAFFVRAATAIPSVYFDSRPDSGRSRDNLPPAPPAPFAGVYAGGAAHLHWGPNAEADFWYYRLHRGASADFVPGPGNLIATTPDTGYVDPAPEGGHYKLAAVDVNDNRSPFATLDLSGVVGAPAGPALAFALEEVRPNPVAGGALTARFSLASGAPAWLELLDVSGRRTVAREVGALGPGRHAIDLLEGRSVRAGIYFVRLRQGGAIRTVRTAVLR